MLLITEETAVVKWKCATEWDHQRHLLTCTVEFVSCQLADHRDLLQLANDLLLSQSCGTVFLMTLRLLHHWHCFDENWKRVHFGRLISGCYYVAFFVVADAVVVLAVIYLGHLNVCNVV